ncbi:radical SAM protein [Candidatus Wolfebacteria bacterium RIFOXYB1_FULL_54_12]|uniref:Radical SAM protein n=1 Tax=Candidatus Wolfebacteria bacterium RIFOXYB1_FULL_54_12 TaxID=1802559 RepID=A0A1F8DXT7_9BACT|nr:MAG: radical SAM protein [Candidatus Wolfebacteria bacterium RIFOXYB1_FULL_54_12]
MAKDLSGQAPGGKRTVLTEVLPRLTPFVVQLFPIYACNFKCNYCIFQLPNKERGFISDKVVMDFDLYKKFIDEFALFPSKIKVLRFVGIGEPLLHPRIADMVAYAVEKQVAHNVELLTNGSLLTPVMSNALIDAGLSRLVVSLQGVSARKYKEICGVDVQFDKLRANLQYFFLHKSDSAHMYCKIVDSALDGEEDKRQFYKLFSGICDSLAIEHTVPIHSGVEYDGVIKHAGEQLTQFGLPVSEVKICPQPFFHMQINPDGKVVPCYSFEYPAIMGDCNTQTVREIWNGERFNAFRRKMLDGKLDACAICKECSIITYRMFPEDMIGEADVERLKMVYG